MKLKELYEKLYEKVFSVSFFKAFLKIPGLEKLLQYEIISYLFFGVMTTVVNFVVFGVMGKLGGADYEAKVLFGIGSFDFKYIYFANAVAWFFAVLFSFITNKLFVFESRSFAPSVAVREIISFFGARIVSFLVFEELLFGIVAALLKNVSGGTWIAKIVTGVLVIVFNYVASKLVIFRKKGGEEEK